MALLILNMGLLIQITTISAQEENLPLADEQMLDELFLDDDPSVTPRPVFTFEDETPVSMRITDPSSAWSIIWMILVLALCAAAIYGIVFFIKKASRRTVRDDPFLKVLANTNLGLNRYVHIVSVGSKAWLVGAGENGVNLISEIEDKEIVDAMLLEDSRKGEAASSRLGDFMSMMRHLGVRTAANAPGTDDIRKHRERLRKL
ncbi:MAG: flagellar biosynthetic protein FliO [Treponema sp.]|nr:flagellar biosynthetic protein FliO [Treponema sp.]